MSRARDIYDRQPVIYILSAPPIWPTEHLRGTMPTCIAFSPSSCWFSHFPPARGITPRRVVGIADGDTITILKADKTQHRIRLWGVDAPETGQDFGSRAKQAASSLAFGKQVTIRARDTDRYGPTGGRRDPARWPLDEPRDGQAGYGFGGIASMRRAIPSWHGLKPRRRHRALGYGASRIPSHPGTGGAARAISKRQA